MARPRKQPPRAAQNLPYGQGQAMAEAQKVIPLPDNRGMDAPPPSVEGGGGDPNAPAAMDPQSMALLAAMGMENPTGSLTSETARPDEPLTAGIDLGAGPGSQQLAAQVQQTGSVADFFRLAAQVFGYDDDLARMADRARQRGL